jgi:hypothetical protein
VLLAVGCVPPQAQDGAKVGPHWYHPSLASLRLGGRQDEPASLSGVVAANLMKLQRQHLTDSATGRECGDQDCA